MKNKCAALIRIALAAVCILAAFFTVSCAEKIEYTLEAGKELPNAVILTGNANAAYVAGFDEDCVNKPGKYKISLTDGEKDYILHLTVVDETAPIVTPRHVYYAVGTESARAEDFIAAINEVDEYTAYFVGDVPTLDAIGDYDIQFEVKDKSGNVSKTYTSLLSVIHDTEAPTFAEVPELSAYIGEAVAYRRGLVVTDNCGGEITVEVDSSKVDTSTPGDYTVTYSAVDGQGNTSYATTTIHIYDAQVTANMLYDKLDAVIATIITENMDAEDKCRAVYEYVQSSISYVSDSDKSDMVRAAYDSLFVTGTGDCYNYHAATVMFMKRLGIPYLEIQRTEGASDGTHYWCMVNIGTSESPRWYHLDTTRLRADYNHSGCLLTDKQVNAYNRVRKGFYAYDTSAYPKSFDAIITRTPNLEPYY
ncbi:MAG: DUF5011 domain-containing protein [Ruminococcaceae bacterium]|nr:DUF5011 domain-containing protein [Oscillospiraceae bacterium]